MISFLKSFSSNIHYKYNVNDSSAFTTGCWTVYDAKNKSTNELVSVLVLSKKHIAKLMSQNGVELRTQMWEEIKEFASKGVQELTKIRHPAVVRVIEPLESGRGTLTFVTERLVAKVEDLHESDLDELSVVRGLTTVIQALSFLHKNLGLVHLNVSPETLVVDAQGDWKVMGLDRMVKYENFSTATYHLPQRDSRLPYFMHPAYDFMAPELVMEKTVVPANDVWSISMVLYVIYVRSRPLKTRLNPNAYREEYQRFRARLPSVLPKFPAKLQPYVDSLYSDRAEGRITLEILETTDFFQNPLIKALKGVDEYPAKPVEDKESFLKHLQGLLPQFPKQVRLRKIVKFAVTELSGAREPATGTLLGNTLFTAAVDMSALSFSDQVLPIFKNLADWTPFQESVAANISVVTNATSDKDFSKHVVPLFVDALKFHDAQHAPIQIQILKGTAGFAKHLTVAKMEESFFSSVMDCFSATPNRAVKIAATQGLQSLITNGLSKALISDRLIPALQAMKTRDPAVVVAVSNLWNSLSPRLNSEQIFTLALPHLLTCSMASQLTVDQFKHVMDIVQEQIDSVKKSQMTILRNNKPQDTDDWLNEPVETTPGISVGTHNDIRSPNSKTIDAYNLRKTREARSSDQNASSARTDKVLGNHKSTGLDIAVLASSSPATTSVSKPLPSFPSTSSTATLQPQKFGVSQKPSYPIMTPLVPAKPGQSASSNDLMSVMQPMKPDKVSSPALTSKKQNDEYGAFVSSDNGGSLI